MSTIPYSKTRIADPHLRSGFSIIWHCHLYSFNQRVGGLIVVVELGEKGAVLHHRDGVEEASGVTCEGGVDIV